MRTHSTRAKPMSIERAVRNGNASLDRSTDVSDCSSSRDRGPCTLICAKPEVMSVTNACMSSVMCRRIQVSACRCAVSEATTQNRSSSSLVTVRSASSVPPSLSHCVYVMTPGVAVDVVGRQVLEQPARVAALHEELRHERHVHRDDVLAGRAVLGRPPVEPVLPAPRQRLDDRRRLARRRVPVGALPAADVAEVRAARGEPVVQRRSASRRAPSASSGSGSGTGRPCRATRRCASRGTPGWPGSCAAGRCSCR